MKKLLITSVVTASLLMPFAASALIIDHFDVGAIHITTPVSPEPGGTATSGLVVGDAIGGYRVVSTTQIGGVTPSGSSADAIPPASILSLSSKDGVDAGWSIQYFGNGGGISPAANFSAGGALGVFVLFGTADLGGGSIDMIAFDGTSARRTGLQPIPVGATTLFFPFTSFVISGSGPGPVNFANIVGFQVDINGVNSYDASLHLLETRESGRVPDAAGTMMLMTIALGLLGAARLKMAA